MKKIWSIICVLAVFSYLNAADFTGIKIYVNPGHGGYNGANDRNVVTIPFALNDTLGFWESSSNLTKGLALRDLLLSQGATVYISRTLNRDEDDRSLSEIAEEANANGIDAFLSIHSNALGTNTGTNYLLQLYHGYDNQPTVEASLPMVKAAWPRLIDNKLTVWTNYPTATTVNYRGDYSFYGNTSGLGVLRPLTVPGFLNEGSFHDYPPETHRLLNKDYRKLESYRFLQYFCDYFGKDLPATGVVGGWVKGKDERVSDSRFIYKASTDDEWAPLNGARVKLMTSTGDSINNYNVDTLYNGIFTFTNLTPGTYKLRITAKDHTTKDTTVVVAAGAISYMKVMMRNPNLPIYNIVPADYPNPTQDAGALPLEHYNFQSIKQANPDWVTPTTSLRKVLFKNEKLYVLSEDTITNVPKVSIINASTFEKTGDIDLTGISGGAKILSDINFAADGVLMGCNKDTIAFSETKGRYFKVYYWESDTDTPHLLFQSQSQANWSNGVVGETFTVSGAKFKCSIYTTSVTTGASKAVRIIGYNYQDNVVLGYRYMADPNSALYTENTWGKKIKFTISPSGTDKIVVDGEKMLPTEYQFDWAQPDKSPLVLQSAFAEKNGYQLQTKSFGGTFFRNASHVYYVAPNGEADNSKVGIVLFDVNDGLGSAKKVSEFLPEGGLGITPAPYMMAAAKVSGYDIDLIGLAEKQGIARFKNVAASNANVYASELKLEENETSYTLSFTLNDAITSGKVSIFNTSQEIYSETLGALAKGVQTVSILKSNLPQGDYNWSVTVNGNTVDRPYKYSNDADVPMQYYYPRGIAVDNAFESPYFGRVYISEATGGAASSSRTTKDGIYILNSSLSDITNQGANAYAGNITWGSSGSPMRVFVGEDGSVYVNDWSDTHPGVWMMNPATPQGTFSPNIQQFINQSLLRFIKQQRCECSRLYRSLLCYRCGCKQKIIHV
ncbi:MAG: N-acetylmuramoyl-L-alanine amidase [Paludibacteraceae bacterium]